MLNIVFDIILIGFTVFIISIMGLGIYVAYKMIKEILKEF